MNKVNKMEFTLDNLSYKCVILDDTEEIQIVLPCSTLPDKTEIFKKQTKKKKKAIVIKSANTVKISVLFVNKTNGSPKVTLTSNSTESKIIGNVILKPNTNQIFEFMSANGGLNWFIDALGKQDDETTINGKLGPIITISADDIKVSEDPDSVTIGEKLDELSEVKIAGPDTIGGIMAAESGDIDVNSEGVTTIKNGSVTTEKLSTEVKESIDGAVKIADLGERGVVTGLFVGGTYDPNSGSDGLRVTAYGKQYNPEDEIDPGKELPISFRIPLSSMGAASKADLDSANDEIDSVKTDVSGLHDSVDTLQGDLDATKTDLDATKTDLEATKTDLEGTKSDLETTKSNLEATKTDLDTTKSNLADTQSDVSALQTEVSEVKTDVAGIHDDITSLHTDIDTVQSNLDNAVKDINDNLPDNVMDIVADNVENSNIVIEPFNI